MEHSRPIQSLLENAENIEPQQRRVLGLCAAVRVCPAAMYYLDALDHLEDFYQINDGVDHLWRVVRGINTMDLRTVERARRVGEAWLQRIQDDPTLCADLAEEAICVMLSSIDLFLQDGPDALRECLVGAVELEAEIACAVAEQEGEDVIEMAPMAFADREFDNAIRRFSSFASYLEALDDSNFRDAMTELMLSVSSEPSVREAMPILIRLSLYTWSALLRRLGGDSGNLGQVRCQGQEIARIGYERRLLAAHEPDIDTGLVRRLRHHALSSFTPSCEPSATTRCVYVDYRTPATVEGQRSDHTWTIVAVLAVPGPCSSSAGSYSSTWCSWPTGSTRRQARYIVTIGSSGFPEDVCFANELEDSQD